MTLPEIRVGGKRYRPRLRLLSRKWVRFTRCLDTYPEGRVHRVWLGFLLVVVMVDSA